eukprot:463473_1
MRTYSKTSQQQMSPKQYRTQNYDAIQGGDDVIARMINSDAIKDVKQPETVFVEPQPEVQESSKIDVLQLHQRKQIENDQIASMLDVELHKMFAVATTTQVKPKHDAIQSSPKIEHKKVETDPRDPNESKAFVNHITNMKRYFIRFLARYTSVHASDP